MLTAPIPSVVLALCALSVTALAQQEKQQDVPMPKPAPELKRLEPLVGSWEGSGVVHDASAGDLAWTATGRYGWSHDGFWLQEDFAIRFEGMPTPMVIRAYLGWDAENRRYVNVHAGNNGEVGVDEFRFLPDGTMTTLVERAMPEASYLERASSRTDGDKMTMTIDLLMAEGPSTTVVEGTFARVDADAAPVLDAGAFGPPVPEAMTKLCRGAGTYDTVGTMVMEPGAPRMGIRGSDRFTALWGGKVLRGRTDGEAEGMPGRYTSEMFVAWNEKRGCYVSAFVSNMGEVGEMEMRWSEDGKALIGTGAMLMRGQPVVQRFVLECGDDGAFVRGVGHAIVGTAPPFEGFNATYTKK